MMAAMVIHRGLEDPGVAANHQQFKQQSIAGESVVNLDPFGT